MNWAHFHTLLWLRYRLTVNHIRRYGATNLVILSIASGFALVGSVTGFFGTLIAGMTFLPDVSPDVLMYLCDGWLLVFLFCWLLGVMTDLQRGEMLSVDKLLHLPTTLAEVFVFNFLSSLVSLTTLSLIPPMLGFCIAVVLTKGIACLVMFPLLIAFVLMITAVTYQFRGWLATLMANKRRQRTIVVIMTFTFVLLMQIPQLANLAYQRQRHRSQMDEIHRREELTQKWKTGTISREEFEREISKKTADRDPAMADRLKRGVEWANVVLPVGWLAYGTKAAATGNPWPGLAGAIAMGGIAAFCLRRSYRTTLQYFTGDFEARPLRAPVAVAAVARSSHQERNRLEWSIPLVSEPTAVVACATLTSLLRAPEVKMMLLGPLVIMLIFGATLIPGLPKEGMPDFMRSLMPLGVLGLSISGVMQLTQNMFAFDRSGFRAFVLSGVPRHQILMGKNLALTPLVFVPSILLMVILQFLAPIPLSAFVTTLVVMPTAYMWLCVLGNYGSMLCPIGQAAGSMKPVQLSGVTMLLQFVFLFATALIVGTASLVPLGLEWLLHLAQWVPATLPVALIIAALELALSVLLYRIVIRYQGDFLQSRECRILDVVIAKGE